MANEMLEASMRANTDEFVIAMTDGVATNTIALCVVAAAGLLTLLITRSVKDVAVVVAPLLLVLGVSATRL